MTTSTANKNLWCVVYRMGGTANYTWQRTDAVSKEMAKEVCADVARMGYRAMVVNYARSMSIGLPETYE